MAKQFQVDTNGTLTTSLVSYYKLEDATDYYGSNNLTNEGSVTFGTPGKVNNAAQLSGSNNLYSTGLTFSYGAFSMAGWIYYTGTAQKYFINTPGSSGTEWYFFLIINNPSANKIVWGFNKASGGTETDIFASTTLSTGTWYHVACTWDGTTNANGAKIYINGSLDTSVTAHSNTSVTANPNVTLGASSNTGVNGVTGAMDEWGFWTKALSTQEVTDLYNGGSGQTMTSGSTTWSRTGSTTMMNAASRYATVSRTFKALRASSVSMMNAASRYATATRVYTTIRSASASMMNAASRYASAVRGFVTGRTASVSMMNAASRYATASWHIFVLWVRTASVSMMNAASRYAKATKAFIIKISNVIRWDFWTFD